jgi:hypothetical protein
MKTCTECEQYERLLKIQNDTLERQKKEILKLKTDIMEMNVRIHERTQGFLRRK